MKHIRWALFCAGLYLYQHARWRWLANIGLSFAAVVVGDIREYDDLGWRP